MSDVPKIINVTILDWIDKIKNGEKNLYYQFFSIDDLLYRDSDGKSLLQYALEYNVKINLNLLSIFRNEEALKIYVQYVEKLPKYDWLYNEEVLFTKVIGEKRVIDLLFEQNVINGPIISLIQNNTEIYDLCIKYNRRDYLKDFTCSILTKTIGDKTYLEIILEEGITPSEINNCKKLDIAKILYKIYRPDLLLLMDKYILLKNADEDMTYLEFILKSYKYGTKVDLVNLKLSKKSFKSDDVAKIYILFCKYNLLEHLEILTKEDLFEDYEKKESLLDKMILIDPDLTKEVLKYYSIMYDLDIDFVFQDNEEAPGGIEGVEMPIYEIDFKKFYLKSEEIPLVNLSPSETEIIDKFRNIMLKDGSSDEKLIDFVINSYKRLIANNYPYATKELEILIDIKEHKSIFSITQTEKTSYFSAGDGICLNMDQLLPKTIYHEVTHALHWHLIFYEKFPNFDDIVLRIQHNPIVKEKSNEFFRNVEKIENLIIKRFECLYEEWEKTYYTEEKIREIEEFLQNEKNEEIEYYVSIGYDEEFLRELFDKNLNIEEYMESVKSIYYREMIDYIMESEYSNIVAICDIIDAVYKGSLSWDIGFSENHDFIFWGHGKAYYNNSDYAFPEILADYSVLLKCNNSSENIDLLRSILGDEFVNLLDEFYREKIVNSTTYSPNKERVLN